MKEKTCCFTGHREIVDDIIKLRVSLKTELVQLINNEIIYFGAGGARGFDTLAAKTFIELKSTYSQIKFILVLPCSNQVKGWNREDTEIYESIKRNADKIKVLSQYYYNGCMHARNRHMVNCSAVCVCYKRKDYGGTAYTVNYAKQKGLRIIEI